MLNRIIFHFATVILHIFTCVCVFFCAFRNKIFINFANPIGYGLATDFLTVTLVNKFTVKLNFKHGCLMQCAMRMPLNEHGHEMQTLFVQLLKVKIAFVVICHAHATGKTEWGLLFDGTSSKNCEVNLISPNFFSKVIIRPIGSYKLTQAY